MSQRVLLMGSMFLASFGSTVALLGSTTITTQLGTEVGAAAMFTGVMLAVKFAPSIIAMPYTTWFAARFETRRLFISGQGLMVVLNLALALALFAGAPAYATLLLFTAAMGVFGAMLHVLVPMVMKAYLPSRSLAGSLSTAAVANGLAAVAGALFGTVLLTHMNPVYSFVVNGLLTVPYVIVLLLAKTATPVDSPASSHHTWRTLASTLRTNRRVLRASVLAVGAFLLVGPLNSMVVPLTQDLGIALTANAGYLLAVLALGQIFSPYSVSAVGRRLSAIFGGILAIAIAGVALVGFALVALVGDPRWLLYTGIAIAALIFGNMRISAENLLVDDVASSTKDGESAQGNIAAFEFMVSVAAPFGPLLWGVTMDGVGARATLAIFGALTLGFAVVMWMTARRSGASHTPLILRG